MQAHYYVKLAFIFFTSAMFHSPSMSLLNHSAFSLQLFILLYSFMDFFKCLSAIGPRQQRVTCEHPYHRTCTSLTFAEFRVSKGSTLFVSLCDKVMIYYIIKRLQ